MIVSLMKKKFVDEYHWIEENEMLDLVAIAQSAPGAIAVNGAIVVGYKLAGIAGDSAASDSLYSVRFLPGISKQLCGKPDIRRNAGGSWSGHRLGGV